MTGAASVALGKKEGKMDKTTPMQRCIMCRTEFAPDEDEGCVGSINSWTCSYCIDRVTVKPEPNPCPDCNTLDGLHEYDCRFSVERSPEATP